MRYLKTITCELYIYISVFCRDDFESGRMRIKCAASIYDAYYKVKLGRVSFIGSYPTV